jgi:predicted esterase
MKFFFLFFVIFICCCSVQRISTFATNNLPIPPTWYYLGPFIYGKTENDGNVLLSCSSSEGNSLDSVFNTSTLSSGKNFFTDPQQQQKIQKSLKYYSEVNVNGFVRWKPVQIRKNGDFVGQFTADHYTQLVEIQQHHLAGETSAMEFVGFAVGFFGSVQQDGVYVFETMSIHTIFFNNIPLSADQFGRGYRVSVFLKKSSIPVRISVRVRGSRGQASFVLKSLGILAPKKSTKPSVKSASIHHVKSGFSPDLVCDLEQEKCNFYLTNGLTKGSVVVQSHLHDEILKNVRVVVQDDEKQSGIQVPTTATNKNNLILLQQHCDSKEFLNHVGRDAQKMFCQALLFDEEIYNIPPLHTRTISFPLQVSNEAKMFHEKCFGGPKKNDVEVISNFKILANVVKHDQDDETGEETLIGTFSMKFRCRKLTSQSFLITYQDFDKSPAQSGIILPLNLKKRKLMPSKNFFPILLSLHGTGVSPLSQADSHKYKPDQSDDFVFGVEGAFVVTPDRHGAHNWEGLGKMSALHAAFLVGVNGFLLENNNNNNLHKQNSLMIPDCKSIIAVGHSQGAHGALILSSQHPQLMIGVALLAPWIKKENYGDSNKIFALDRSAEHTFRGSRRKMVIEASIADNELQLENLLHVPVFVRTGAVDFTVSPFFARRIVRMLREEGHENVTYEEPKKQQHWWWDSKKPNDGGCMNDESIRDFFAKIIDSYFQKQTTTNQKKMKKFVFHSPFSTSVGEFGQRFQQKIPMQKSTIIFSDDDANNQRFQNIIVSSSSSSTFKKKFGPIRQYMEAPLAIATLKQMKNHNSAEQEEQKSLFGSLLSSSSTKSSNNSEQDTELNLVAKFIADSHLVAFDSDVPVLFNFDLLNNPKKPKISRRRMLLIGTLSGEEENSAVIDFGFLFPFPVQVGKTCIRFGDDIIVNGTDLVLMTIFPSSEVFLNGGVLLFSQSIKAMRHAVHEIGMPTIPPMMRPPFGNLLPDFFISDANLAHLGYGSFLAGGYFEAESFRISKEMMF